MTHAEWLRELAEHKEYAQRLLENEVNDLSDLPQEVAALRAGAEALEEIAGLRAEVKEWLCEKCCTVYPGPPAEGVQCVVCPKCGGSTWPRHWLEKQRAEAENARLKETYTDDEGTVWTVPTAWAYAQACKALKRQQWRPISELDIDDRRAFLGYCPEVRCTFAMTRQDGAFYYFGAGGGVRIWYDVTRWMPLPPAPAEGGTDAV